MTRSEPARLPAALLSALAVILAGGALAAGTISRPSVGEAAARAARSSEAGQVLAVFTALSPAGGGSPDGVSRAALRAMGRRDCSVAFFHWQRRDLAGEWIRAQLESRRRLGFPANLILAGYGAGGAAAAETAHALMARGDDVAIVLLLTVDAVKTDRLTATVGAAGSAIASRIPGVSANFTAYESFPLPDGFRLWSHVNYYQDRSDSTRGAPASGAENHPIHDSSGLLNHDNAADFVFPLLVADFRAALERTAP